MLFAVFPTIISFFFNLKTEDFYRTRDPGAQHLCETSSSIEKQSLTVCPTERPPCDPTPVSSPRGGVIAASSGGGGTIPVDGQEDVTEVSAAHGGAGAVQGGNAAAGQGRGESGDDVIRTKYYSGSNC